MKGFSLIEALITIMVVGVLGLALAGLISRAFQSDTKTELIGEVKQNGQIVLNEMDRVFKNSEAVICPTSGVSSSVIAVQTKDQGRFIRYFIVPESQTKNGYIARQQFDSLINPNTVDLCRFDQTYTETSPAPVVITNNLSSSAISVKSGSFAVDKSAGFKDTVTIIFSLGAKIKSGSAFENLVGGPSNSVEFKTSVQLR